MIICKSGKSLLYIVAVINAVFSYFSDHYTVSLIEQKGLSKASQLTFTPFSFIYFSRLYGLGVFAHS